MEFLSESALVASGVVLLVEEILKLKIVPVGFANKYPIHTNVLLSIIATLFLVEIKVSLDNIGYLAIQIATVGVVAAIAYNQLFREAVKPLEGKPEPRTVLGK